MSAFDAEGLLAFDSSELCAPPADTYLFAAAMADTYIEDAVRLLHRGA
ncbi:hypothetical protein [Hominenteromicrobium sp.]